ncbi:MAG: hypothetical protein ACRD8Z_10355 [Nitrososphaeraceae archaeon]
MSAWTCLMQISTTLVFNYQMNSKYMVVVAAMAVMLIGATALATDDAFADKKRHDDKKKGGYEKSQATAQTNYCGNGEAPLYVFCSNTASQIQGDDNSAALASEQESEEEDDMVT